jgi:hypothetical protein
MEIQHEFLVIYTILLIIVSYLVNDLVPEPYMVNALMAFIFYFSYELT